MEVSASPPKSYFEIDHPVSKLLSVEVFDKISQTLQ